MADRPERFTVESRELKERAVYEGIAWEGKIWVLNDYHRSSEFWFHTEQEAREAFTFVRQYVQRHGDIDFGIFPNSLETPLRIKNPR